MSAPIKARLRSLIGPVAWVLVLGFAIYLAVSFALVYGATRAERKPLEARPSQFGVEQQGVNFPPRGGGPLLEGWFLQGSPDSPYLIFVHGIGGQRSSDGAVDLASRLVKQGYNVLLFDLRGHGTSQDGRVSGGYFERNDALGAYDFLVSRGARPGRVGFLGLSMGAGISIMAAAREPGIAAVVADSPFADIDGLIAQETARRTPMPAGLVPVFVPGAQVIADLLYGIDFGDIKPERDAARLAYPIYVIHGQADERIPVSHGRRVYEAAPAGSEFWSVPDVDHVDAFKTHPDEYVRRVVAYLQARFP